MNTITMYHPEQTETDVTVEYLHDSKLFAMTIKKWISGSEYSTQQLFLTRSQMCSLRATMTLCMEDE